MIGYRFLSTALTEASDAALFYEKESGGLGTKFLDAIDITIEKLRKFPTIGSPHGQRLRSFSIPRFPYDLVYYVGDQEMLIIAVAHQSRRPDYWKDRL